MKQDTAKEEGGRWRETNYGSIVIGIIIRLKGKRRINKYKKGSFKKSVRLEKKREVGVRECV